jgi:hypothetical protein
LGVDPAGDGKAKLKGQVNADEKRFALQNSRMDDDLASSWGSIDSSLKMPFAEVLIFNSPNGCLDPRCQIQLAQ